VKVKALFLSSGDGIRRVALQGGGGVVGGSGVETDGIGPVGDGVIDCDIDVVASPAVVGEVDSDLAVVSGPVDNEGDITGDEATANVVGTGHGPELQACVSFLLPTQSDPLLLGGGLVQVRKRIRLPTPQVELHRSQGPQFVKPPSTENCTPNVAVRFCKKDCKIFVTKALSSEIEAFPDGTRT